MSKNLFFEAISKFVISRQTLSHDKMGWKQKILADLMESFIGALFIGINPSIAQKLISYRSRNNRCRRFHESCVLSTSEALYNVSSLERPEILSPAMLLDAASGRRDA